MIKIMKLNLLFTQDLHRLTEFQVAKSSMIKHRTPLKTRMFSNRNWLLFRIKTMINPWNQSPEAHWTQVRVNLNQLLMLLQLLRKVLKSPRSNRSLLLLCLETLHQVKRRQMITLRVRIWCKKEVWMEINLNLRKKEQVYLSNHLQVILGGFLVSLRNQWCLQCLPCKKCQQLLKKLNLKNQLLQTCFKNLKFKRRNQSNLLSSIKLSLILSFQSQTLPTQLQTPS